MAISALAGCYGAPEPLPVRPVAVAGIDRFVTLGTPVALDGSQSSSIRGEPLTYQWALERRPEGSSLTDAAFSPNGTGEAASPTFLPDLPGRYVVKLVVADGTAESIGDYVALEVEGNLPTPVASAGPDLTVTEGMAVYLDGTASQDPEGDTLFYRWTLAGAPSLSDLTQADLVNAYTPFPSFIVDTGGVYTLALVVGDGTSESAPDYVFVTALSNNSAPVADAGGDQRIEACTWIGLDGSASYDIDQDPLSWQWSMLLAPIGSSVTTDALSDPHLAAPQFYADRTGDYVLELEVSDGAAWSTPDVVRLTAAPRANNSPPGVEAGTDQTLAETVICSGTGGNAYCPDCPAGVVTVSGEGTMDADDDGLTYFWQVLEGDALIQDASRRTTPVELRGASARPGETVTTSYRLTLTATDCPGSSASDEVVIEYRCTGTY